jgi:hypothetical protein
LVSATEACKCEQDEDKGVGVAPNSTNLAVQRGER